MKLAALATLAVALLPAAARAVPPAPRAGRSPARSADPNDSLPLQVARAVFPRERWQKLVRDASASLTEELIVGGRGEYELAPEFADRLREEYEKLAPYEELVASQARILGHEYTPAELKQLLRFFRSPLGQRSVVLLHDVAQVSQLQLRAKVREGLEAALGRLAPLVEPAERAAAPPAGEGVARDGDAEVPDLSASELEAKVL